MRTLNVSVVTVLCFRTQVVDVDQYFDTWYRFGATEPDRGDSVVATSLTTKHNLTVHACEATGNSIHPWISNTGVS